jgi:hypothetical protein
VDLPFEQEVNAFVTEAFEHGTFFTQLHHFVLLSDASDDGRRARVPLDSQVDGEPQQRSNPALRELDAPNAVGREVVAADLRQLTCSTSSTSSMRRSRCSSACGFCQASSRL